ncbi:MAG TPA: hypothetical protein VEA78_08410 [Acidimicrobiales bacterium]|nr:hypothetical protein [Acidimicrobiales bacterium]
MSDRHPEPKDRRVQFFLVAAVACFLLYEPTPGDLRWVPLVLGTVYTLLAVLAALDQRSRRRR